MKRLGYYIGLTIGLTITYLWIVAVSPISAAVIVWRLFQKHRADNIVFVDFRKT